MRTLKTFLRLCHRTGRAARTYQSVATRIYPTYCQRAASQARARGWQPDEPGAYCHRCGTSAGHGSVTAKGCAYCVGQTLPWSQMIRLGPYTEPLSRWIVSMKFGGSWCWATWCGQQLAQTVAESATPTKVIVCPVPMHWARRLQRGYNQAHLIGSTLARRRDWPIASLLRRVRYTPPQTAVPPSRRRANIRRSFSIKAVDLTGWHVWLVDDVKTTGATLTACARLLRRAGARRVDVAIVAVATPSRVPAHRNATRSRPPR